MSNAELYSESQSITSQHKLWYHGTEMNFDIFDTKGLGSHFGTAKQAARSPGGRGIIKVVKVNAVNLFRMDDLYSWNTLDLIDVLQDRLEVDLSEFQMRIYTTPTDQNFDSNELLWQEEIKAIIKTHGYDGIIYSNQHEGSNNEDSIIAFDSEQVKNVEVRTLSEHLALLKLR